MGEGGTPAELAIRGGMRGLERAGGDRGGAAASPRWFGRDGRGRLLPLDVLFRWTRFLGRLVNGIVSPSCMNYTGSSVSFRSEGVCICKGGED